MTKILLLAALMAQGVPATAFAQELVPSVRVSYADLDLTAEAGRQSLDRRLHRAVKSLCPDDNGVRDLSRIVAIRACRASKMEQISAPRAQALAAAERRIMASARH